MTLTELNETCECQRSNKRFRVVSEQANMHMPAAEFQTIYNPWPIRSITHLSRFKSHWQVKLIKYGVSSHIFSLQYGADHIWHFFLYLTFRTFQFNLKSSVGWCLACVVVSFWQGVITCYYNELQRSKKERTACYKHHSVSHLKGACHSKKS